MLINNVVISYKLPFFCYSEKELFSFKSQWKGEVKEGLPGKNNGVSQR